MTKMSSETRDGPQSETVMGGDLRTLAAIPCDPIAIIGIGFRGPAEARTAGALWEMILAGREAWSPIPVTRWNSAAFFHPDHARHGTINVEGGHFLEEDVSSFDAPFFNMTSDEAAAMDPQQRLLLEVAYEGLENAGIPLAQIMGTNTSCFVGSFSADYTDLLLRDPECVPMYQCTNAGQSRAMVANRLSYFYDLKGPSVTVDTACSGSLVAVHLACQSLWTGDASAAIAAGVNLILSHEFMSTMSMMKFLSSDGRCHTFDQKADGYARGEAAGCLILKPLAQALHDHNTIRAVIRGTGSNQDGRTAGITLPNGAAQESLIRSVYARAGLDPSETDFIEAHGTGTLAGDPIETGAIARVFASGRPPDNPLRIGSIKTNVGHLEGASGVAGVIKAVLMLENRMFLPNRNFEKINPRILLDDWKLKIQLHPEPWEATGPHRVSVNSFGYGGSNAHVIVEDALGYLSRCGHESNGMIPSTASKPQYDEPAPNPRLALARMLMISGFDEKACVQYMQALSKYIIDRAPELASEKFLDDLAYTVNERRSVFPWKATVVGDTMAGLAASLSQNAKPRTGVRNPKLGFIFTGQGAQWPGMGKELLEAYPVFKSSILEIDGYLKEMGASFTVQEEITKPQQDSDLNHPSLSQTVCTALQISLVDLLNSWSIHSDSVTGHSSGEIAAAYATGALTMKDAMSVAYYRGVVASQILSENKHKGAMMAVGMSDKEIKPYLDSFPPGQLVVACINSPSSVTISGNMTSIDALAETLKHKPVFSRRLEIGVAYHSPHMKHVAEQYHNLISHIRPQMLERIAEHKKACSTGLFFSSVTGTSVRSDELHAQYWVSNLIGQVKFAESLKKLCFETDSRRTIHTGALRIRRTRAAQKPSVDCLIEIGPHSALSGPIKQTLQADAKLKSADIEYVSVLKRGSNAVATALETASTLASLNYPVDLSAINRPRGMRSYRMPQLLVDLPKYPWNHTKSYWAEPRLSKMYRYRTSPRIDLLGAPDNMACPFEHRWRNYLRTSEHPWLLDHTIQGNIVFPAAGFLAIAIEALIQTNQSEETIAKYILQDVAIQSAMVLNESSAVELMVSLQRLTHHPEKYYSFHIYSISEDNRWTEHCTGSIGLQQWIGALRDGAEETDESVIVPLATEVHGVSVIDVRQFYEKLQNFGLGYGPFFANMTKAHVTQDGGCFAEITIPDPIRVMPASFQHDIFIHPCTLDSIFHTIFPALPTGLGVEAGPVIPVHIEEMNVSSDLSCSPGDIVRVSTQVRLSSKKDVTACIVVASCSNEKFEAEPCISIRGLRCARLEHPESNTKASCLIYHIDWKLDPSFISSNNALVLSGRGEDRPQDLMLQTGYEVMAADYIRAALDEVSISDAERLGESHRSFHCYLSDLLERHDAASSGSVSQIENIDAVPTPGPLHAIGRNLVSIIRNQGNLSSVIKDNHFVNEFWDILSADESYQAAARYINLIGHKNPNISILELGVGTGHIAEIFLNHLVSLNVTPHCGRYTFVHESPSVLALTSKRLEAWSKWVECKPFVLENDFLKQGFETNSFDIIIMPRGLCITHGDQTVLSKLHDLLSPDGCLIAINPYSPKQNISNNLLISALQFLSADEFGPCLDERTENQWNEALGQALFTEITAFAEPEPEERIQFIVAKSRKIGILPRKVSIVSEDKSGVAGHLAAELEKAKCEPNIAGIDNLDCKDRICLVLDTLPISMLVGPSELAFNKIKDMFTHSAGVLWITRGGTFKPVNPDAGLAVGFTRTARAESGVNAIVTLDLDAQNPLSDSRAAELIMNLLATRFLSEYPDENTEYAERDGEILIPRVLENLQANQTMDSINDTEVVTERPFYQPKQSLRLSRNFDAPRFVSDWQTSELPVGYVGIAVHCFGLNEWDTQPIPRDWEADDTLGLTCSGVVYKVGAGVHDITVGDRVACIGTGTARSFYHDRSSAFQRIDDKMSFEVASAIPLAYTIAYYISHHLAFIKPNENVLIHDAGSHYGQAIVDVCALRAARILPIVQNLTQKELLASRFSIPREQILIDGKDDLVRDVLRLTDGKKANIVVAFESQEDRIFENCTAPFGRFVQLQTQTTQNARFTLTQNISWSTFNIYELQKGKSGLISEIWSKVSRLFLEKQLKGPASVDIYNISRVQEATAAIPNQKHVVITTQANDVVKATLPIHPQPLFHEDGSYMLVGGLGGIGREIALWMARNGAKSLVFVNRSGLSKDTSQVTLRELVEKGVRVTVRACNICDETEMQRMLRDISYCAPPIRGLIQAAMVLKDIHIEHMEINDYLDVVGPKYNGTWNLHRNLPTDLDFFLMLSSISGVIGNATQAAYAAGCAFMDSFAAYRRSLGLPAVSLDLGTITDVGYLAENKDLAAKMERQGFQGTDTPTLLSLIQTAMLDPPGSEQFVTGLGQWRENESLGNFDAPLFSHFRYRFQRHGKSTFLGDSMEKLKTELGAATTVDQATIIICDALSRKIASHLSIPVENINSSNPVSEYGVDSHVAVELRNWISRSMDCTIPILEILAKSILELSQRIANQKLDGRPE